MSSDKIVDTIQVIDKEGLLIHRCGKCGVDLTARVIYSLMFTRKLHWGVPCSECDTQNNFTIESESDPVYQAAKYTFNRLNLGVDW